MLCHFFLGANEEFGQKQYSEIRSAVLQSCPSKIWATEKQSQAIVSFQTWMRKCAYAQVNHLKDLPEAKSAEEIRDIWKFFSNPQLKMMYQRLYRDYCDRFLGGLRFWREIQYKIVDEDKARKYMPDGDMNADISAEAVLLTKRFLLYMEAHLDHPVSTVSNADLEDIRVAFGEARMPISPRLSDFKSAVVLHQQLKALYGMDAGCRERRIL